ncbi:FAD-dependent oxidoreductase [Patescibacteria group bacterium]|nr:FAD-dependent oxidoreductase [Patescibacteria group bacterium]
MLTIYKTVVVDKKQLTNNIYFFTFKLVDPPEINFIPGQYLILRVPKGNAFVPRLYSIFSTSLHKDKVEFIVEIVSGGLASTYFLGLNINDTVEFQGPLGQFILRENNREKVFLATGTGIAPVISILESHALPISSYKVFWGLKTYQDVYLFDQVKKFNPKICLSRESDLNMIKAEERSYFDLGHVDAAFDKTIKDKELIQDVDYYLCGRKDITESLRLFLLAKNIPQENIFFEKF